MGETRHSIDVKAPLQAVYNQWTQFEEFPLFMEGVEKVQQNGPTNLFWKVKIGGKEKSWEAEITKQIPDERIAWQSVDGTPNSGEVTFESVNAGLTRVTLQMVYEPEGFWEEAGAALGLASSQVEKDLKRFRDFIEERAAETGGWRGTIAEGGPAEFGATPSEVRLSRKEEMLRPENLVPRHQDSIEESQDQDRASAWPDKKPPSEKTAPPIRPLKGSVHAEGPESIASEYYRESDTILKPTHEQIALRAHQIYLARGGTPGREVEDWLKAEKELTEKQG